MQALLKSQVAVSGFAVAGHVILVTGPVDVAQTFGDDVPVDLLIEVRAERFKVAVLQAQTCGHTPVDVGELTSYLRAQKITEHLESCVVVFAALQDAEGIGV